MSTILLPRKLPPITPHCVAPCMSGAIGIIVTGPPPQPLLDHLLRAVGLARRSHGVDAATEREEHVLVAPHDALGHAGGAAGVEDVAVVGGAGPKSRSGDPPAIAASKSTESRPVEVGAAAVLDDDRVRAAAAGGRARRGRAARTPRW